MSSPPRHLTRNARERCVMARVQRVGRIYYRCFAVRRHGSWEAAEAAARLWLRPVLASLPAVAGQEARMGERNRSGVVGVFFRAGRRVLKSGRPASYPGYVSRWPGGSIGVKWMFTTCGGEEGAFLHACLSRELRSADRLRVSWAVRALTPERRAELLERRRPLAESGPCPLVAEEITPLTLAEHLAAETEAHEAPPESGQEQFEAEPVFWSEPTEQAALAEQAPLAGL